MAFSKNPSPSLWNEFIVSVNSPHTLEHTKGDRIGFGFGILHTNENSRNFHFLFGAEFNHTSQFEESEYGGHFYSLENLTYYFNHLSVPLGLRFTEGGNLIVLVDSRLQLDIPLYCNRTLTSTSFPPYSASHTETKTEKVFRAPEVFACFGFGVVKSFSDFSLLIMPQYKLRISQQEQADLLRENYITLTIGIKWQNTVAPIIRNKDTINRK